MIEWVKFEFMIAAHICVFFPKSYLIFLFFLFGTSCCVVLFYLTTLPLFLFVFNSEGQRSVTENERFKLVLLAKIILLSLLLVWGNWSKCLSVLL